MDNERIQRSRLFRESFLPGAVTRLRNQANARVVGVRNNAVALGTVDQAQLIYTVKKYLNDWEVNGGAVDQGLRNAIDHNKVTLQSPSEIYVDPYPLLLRCETCKVIDFYDPRVDADRVASAIDKRIRSSAHGRSYVRCKTASCPGRMLQVPYVGVHRCGIMSALYVNPTVRRKTNIGYADASGSFFNSFFFDVETGDKLAGSLQDNCPACLIAFAGSSEVNKRGTPVTSGESFYSQVVQYIALSPAVGQLAGLLYAQIDATAGTLTGQTGDIAEGIAGVLLGVIDSAVLERELRAMVSEEAASDDLVKKHTAELTKTLQARDKYAEQSEDDLMAHMLGLANARIAELQSLLSKASGRFKVVRDILDNDATYIALVEQRRAIEAAFLRHDVNRLSMAQAISTTDDAVARQTKRVAWQSVQDRFGVTEVGHIPDLLVVLSALGFTRERRAPVIDTRVPPVVLNGFEDALDPGMRSRTALYAMSAKTEALWIRLDPVKILAWCIAQAGWIDPGAAVRLSSQRAHAHLLQHCPALTMAPSDVVKADPTAPSGQAAPFHLLHSVCHALLGTSRRHTGYDDQSLMEYLLPMDLSFVIYVTSVQNYTAGGLLTLFQHYLLQWFDDASGFAFNCAFDPICSDTGGSCSGCIQRERACETYNHGLSRSYLHGGNSSPGHPASFARGFWDAPLANV